MAKISFPARLRELTDADPDRVSITCGDHQVTRAAFDALSNRLAHDLLGRGVQTGDLVTIALPNSIDWLVAVAACWKSGAVPQPVSARLPRREVDAIIELADSRVVIGIDDVAGRVCLPLGYRPSDAFPDTAPPDVTSPYWKAPTSGGSTGRPKLILSGEPALFDTETGPPLAMSADGCFVMPGPLYHNGPIVWTLQALLAGNHVVVLPRFDAEGTLRAIEEHGADVVYLVPTMMKRILRLDDEVRLGFDLSSLRAVWHLAEPCPQWLKQAWIDWLGPERILELYAGTEAQLATVITGVEWLEHRGSVGKPLTGQIKICDPLGNEVPVGEHGEVWMKSAGDRPTYTYIGAEPRAREDGFESLGDMGYVDEDGYLYLGDRLGDMILSGGANIYPAEVESAIQEHPAVRSCAVIGLPDDDLGNRVHAIVEADEAELAREDLLAFLGERLVRYKIPRSVEFVDEALRSDAGKVRRSALRADRIDG